MLAAIRTCILGHGLSFAACPELPQCGEKPWKSMLKVFHDRLSKCLYL